MTTRPRVHDVSIATYNIARLVVATVDAEFNSSIFVKTCELPTSIPCRNRMICNNRDLSRVWRRLTTNCILEVCVPVPDFAGRSLTVNTPCCRLILARRSCVSLDPPAQFCCFVATILYSTRGRHAASCWLIVKPVPILKDV